MSQPQLRVILARMTRDIVLSMYRMENKIRLSDETQELYDIGRKENIVPPLSIEDEFQRHVLKEHGFATDDLSLYAYRLSRNRYAKDDSEIQNAIVFIKYDMTSDPSFEIGDTVPNVTLLTMDEKPTDLYSLVNNRPAVIVAGSYS